MTDKWLNEMSEKLLNVAIYKRMDALIELLVEQVSSFLCLRIVMKAYRWTRGKEQYRTS
jgi:hypothetical protein